MPEIAGKREKTEADVEMKGKMRRFYGQLLHFAWAIGVAITGFSLWISYRDGYYINSVMKDLLLVFAIGFIGCLIGVKKNKTK